MLSQSDFEAKQVLIVSKGEKLSFKNDNIIITDENGKILHQSTCYRLFAVFVLGYLSVTSGLIQRSKKFGFSIVLMTPAFRIYHVISEIAEGNVLLRRKRKAFFPIIALDANALSALAEHIKNLAIRSAEFQPR